MSIHGRELQSYIYLQRQGKVVGNKMYDSESSYDDIPNKIIKDYTWVVRADLPPLIIPLVKLESTE